MQSSAQTPVFNYQLAQTPVFNYQLAQTLYSIISELKLYI